MNIPADVWRIILPQLTPKDLMSFRATSRRSMELADTESLVTKLRRLATSRIIVNEPRTIKTPECLSNHKFKVKVKRDETICVNGWPLILGKLVELDDDILYTYAFHQTKIWKLDGPDIYIIKKIYGQFKRSNEFNLTFNLISNAFEVSSYDFKFIIHLKSLFHNYTIESRNNDFKIIASNDRFQEIFSTEKPQIQHYHWLPIFPCAVWNRILKLLPTKDQACFALTCRKFYKIKYCQPKFFSIIDKLSSSRAQHKPKNIRLSSHEQMICGRELYKSEHKIPHFQWGIVRSNASKNILVHGFFNHLKIYELGTGRLLTQVESRKNLKNFHIYFVNFSFYLKVKLEEGNEYFNARLN